MIERVRIVQRDFHLLEAQSMGSSASAGVQPAVLVEVVLSDGARGIGEALPWPYFGGETATGAFATLTAHLAAAVVGRDESEWRVLRRRLDTVMPGNALAKCALEMAIVDALCRSRGISMRSLVGGSPTSTLLSYSLSLQDMKAEAETVSRKAAEGFSIIKIKVGVKDPAVDARRIEQVARIAPDVRIRVDYNTTATEAHLRALREVHDRFPIEFCEQPFPVEQHERLQRLRRWFDIPVSLDESVRSARDVERVSREGVADLVSLKLGKLGGICGAIDAITTASRLGMPVYTGAMSETPISMAAFLSIMSFAEYVVPGCDYYFPFDIVDTSGIESGVRRVGAAVELCGEPGHGTTVPRAWFDHAAVVEATGCR